eukprot:765716-Hanusia_phi.AAC.1
MSLCILLLNTLSENIFEEDDDSSSLNYMTPVVSAKQNFLVHRGSLCSQTVEGRQGVGVPGGDRRVVPRVQPECRAGVLSTVARRPIRDRRTV